MPRDGGEVVRVVLAVGLPRQASHLNYKKSSVCMSENPVFSFPSCLLPLDLAHNSAMDTKSSRRPLSCDTFVVVGDGSSSTVFEKISDRPTEEMHEDIRFPRKT
jgi:hypothetical protein